MAYAHNQINRTTEPAIEPVTLDELKDYLRVETTADDALLTSLITVARMGCETFTSRSLITQGWTISINDYPHRDYYELLHGPIQTIDSVTSNLSDDTTAVFDPTKYYLVDASMNGKVHLKYNQSWPSLTLQPHAGVTTVFTAGYGDLATDVPAPLRQGIIAYASHLYECSDALAPLPEIAKALWQPYKIITV